MLSVNVVAFCYWLVKVSFSEGLKALHWIKSRLLLLPPFTFQPWHLHLHIVIHRGTALVVGISLSHAHNQSQNELSKFRRCVSQVISKNTLWGKSSWKNLNLKCFSKYMIMTSRGLQTVREGPDSRDTDRVEIWKCHQLTYQPTVVGAKKCETRNGPRQGKDQGKHHLNLRARIRALPE